MQRGGHGHASLASADDNDAADLAQVERSRADAYLIARARDVRFHRHGRVYGANRRSEHLCDDPAQLVS
jgi:hypothetical protein